MSQWNSATFLDNPLPRDFSTSTFTILYQLVQNKQITATKLLLETSLNIYHFRNCSVSGVLLSSTPTRTDVTSLTFGNVPSAPDNCCATLRHWQPSCRVSKELYLRRSPGNNRKSELVTRLPAGPATCPPDTCHETYRRSIRLIGRDR